MLYIVGDTSITWPTVARALAAALTLDMIALAYPGHDLPAPFAVAVRPESLEPVTTWDEGERPVFSERHPVDECLLDAVAALPTDVFEADWDLALYTAGSPEWVACAVPHEEIVLVAKPQLAALLDAAGIVYSADPPEGW